MLPPFENRGLEPNFDGSILLPWVRSCITWAGCGSYPWLTILALILISFSTDESHAQRTQ